MKRKISLHKTIFILIFTLFVFTRLFRLDSIPFGPHGLHIDEMGAAYDSFCISEYGVDQYHYKMPVYFRCFGESQDALYTYLAAILFKFTGVSILAFRLPAVFCAIAGFFALFFLAELLFKKPYTLLALFLMTIMPVYMMSERWGLQCYLWLSVSIVSMYFLIKAVSENRATYFFWAGILWGLTLYTYAITYLVIPFFLIVTLLYLAYVNRIGGVKNVLLVAIPFFVLGFPLLIQQLVAMGMIAPFRFMGMIDFWRGESYRSDSVGVSCLLDNLIHSARTFLVSDSISYNANARFGTIYYISIPFLVIGLIVSIKKLVTSLKARTLDVWCVILIYYVVIRIALLFVYHPNINRANGIYFPYLLFTVLGIEAVVDKLGKRAFLYALTGVYFILFVAFSYYLFSYNGYREDTDMVYLKVDTTPGEALAYAKKNYSENEIFAVINNDWYTDYIIALFTETSPYDYQNDEEYYDNDKYNGVTWGVLDELDLSGDTVYVVADYSMGHITSYLLTEGFQADNAFDGYSILHIPESQ